VKVTPKEQAAVEKSAAEGHFMNGHYPAPAAMDAASAPG